MQVCGTLKKINSGLDNSFLSLCYLNVSINYFLHNFYLLHVTNQKEGMRELFLYQRIQLKDSLQKEK